jgi:hypothetical protein
MMISENSALSIKAVGMVALGALINVSIASRAQAQAARANPAAAGTIVVIDKSFDFVLEAGKKVTTPCFEFTVPVKSRLRGAGCRVFAFVQGEKLSFDTPYASLEILSDDPPGLGLDATAKSMLDTLSAQDAKRGARKPDAGKYDTIEGKYLGQNAAGINDMPAVFMRWGQESNPNVKEIEIGCPKKDFRSTDPKLAPYANVTIRMLSTLPRGRYVWGGKPQGFFMAYGREKACDGPYFNRVMATFKLL